MDTLKILSQREENAHRIPITRDQVPSESLTLLSSNRQIFIGKVGKEIDINVLRPLLIVGLQRELRVKNLNSKRSHLASSVLVTVGNATRIETGNHTIMMIVLDDLGIDLFSLSQKKKNVIFDCSKSELWTDFEDTMTMRKWANLSLASANTVPTTANRFDAWFNSKAMYTYHADRRVVEAINELKLHYDQNVPVEEIANKVYLSPTRLIELFKQTTGSSIRSFRLWLRICAAIRHYSYGADPQTAVLDAGFADYSQFSRKFKEMFGASPCHLNTSLNKNKIACPDGKAFLW